MTNNASRAVHIVVLAAGKGTRMKSDLSKVLHRLAGRPLIHHVLDAGNTLQPATVTVVVGHQAGAVKASLADRSCSYVLQEPQLGTGHALLQAEQVLSGRKGDVLLLSGDVPLLDSHTMAALVEAHRRARAAATVLTAEIDDPGGYGRVVREDGRIARIVEHRDASEREREIREINSGVYVFDLEPGAGLGLFDALRRIGSNNAQGEYYLPDLVALYRREGLTVETMTLPDANQIRGVNSRAELAELSRDMRRRKCDELMAAGVTIEDPAATYIDSTVTVGADTIIRPNVYLEGATVIGARCEIHSGSRLVNATVADDVLIRNHCVVQDSTIDAKANHLSYLGDAVVGAKANIGAGTITCNYDGVSKHQTVIEDGAFIGSDTQLVAPVRVGKGAYVGAGSSIVEDVPAGALAIARGKQVNKEGWVEKNDARQKRGK